MKHLTNQRFGRLVALYPIDKRSKDNFIIWKCFCDCGSFAEVIGRNLTKGLTKSCGCLRKEEASRRSKTHGDTVNGKTMRLYRIYANIKQRCLNSNNPSYKHYGGREITICEEWKNSYIAFKTWALANGYADDLTIDRIDNDKGYSPNNCWWITKSDNLRKSNYERPRKPI